MIRLETLRSDTDSEEHAGLEKVMRSLAQARGAAQATGAPTKVIVAQAYMERAAKMFRELMARRASTHAALDEAATGRRRQRANARKPRRDYLQTTLMDIVAANNGTKLPAVIDELKRRALLPDEDPDRCYPRIEHVDDDAVDWREPGNLTASAPIKGLKDRLSRAREALGLVRRPRKARWKTGASR